MTIDGLIQYQVRLPFVGTLDSDGLIQYLLYLFLYPLFTHLSLTFTFYLLLWWSVILPPLKLHPYTHHLLMEVLLLRVDSLLEIFAVLRCY